MSLAAKTGGGIMGLLIFIMAIRLPIGFAGLDFVMLLLMSGFVGIVTYAFIASIINS